MSAREYPERIIPGGHHAVLQTFGVMKMAKLFLFLRG